MNAISLEVESKIYLCFLILFSLRSYGNFVDFKITPPNGIVYGDHDDRKFVSQASLKNFYSKGIYPAALLDKVYANDNLQTRWNLCSSERWALQPALALCSGFLISEKLLMTAGHCLVDEEICRTQDGMGSLKCSQEVCKNQKEWVFDYYLGKEKRDPRKTFQCEKVLHFSHEEGRRDWALIELNRKVPFFKKSPKWSTDYSSKISLLGHPMGLPLVQTTNGEVTSESKEVLLSNIDAFKVNSGSVVLNKKSEIVGMLIAGEPDTVIDMEAFLKVKRQSFEPVCRKVNVCTDCTGGEKIVPTRELKKLLLGNARE